MTTSIAIILARGGSKGIKKKNLSLVGGLSLIERSVKACSNAKYLSEIVVSSDSEEILDVAAKSGAKLVTRPPELATDTSTSEVGWIHAIETISKWAGSAPNLVSFIQCTSPFLDVEALDQSIINSRLDDYDSFFSAVPDHGFYWTRDGESFVGVNHSHLEQRQRRQDRQIYYRETGQFYTVKSKPFMKTKNRFCTRPKPIVTRTNPLDIDTIEDLHLARILHQS